MVGGDYGNPCGSSLESRGHSTVVVCNCGLKARFAVVKTVRNYKRDDACDFFQLVHTDKELYAETSAMNEALESTKQLRKVRVLEHSLEDFRSKVNSLMEENDLLKKMAAAEGLKDHGYVVEGKLSFRRRDAILEELVELRKVQYSYRCLMVAHFVFFVGTHFI